MNAQAQKAIWDFGPSKLAEELRNKGDDNKVTEAAVYAWLSGRSSPRPPKARAIIEIVPGVTMDDLMAKHEILNVGDRRQLPKIHTQQKDAANG